MHYLQYYAFPSSAEDNFDLQRNYQHEYMYSRFVRWGRARADPSEADILQFYANLKYLYECCEVFEKKTLKDIFYEAETMESERLQNSWLAKYGLMIFESVESKMRIAIPDRNIHHLANAEFIDNEGFEMICKEHDEIVKCYLMMFENAIRTFFKGYFMASEQMKHLVHLVWTFRPTFTMYGGTLLDLKNYVNAFKFHLCLPELESDKNFEAVLQCYNLVAVFPRPDNEIPTFVAHALHSLNDFVVKDCITSMERISERSMVFYDYAGYIGRHLNLDVDRILQILVTPSYGPFTLSAWLTYFNMRFKERPLGQVGTMFNNSEVLNTIVLVDEVSTRMYNTLVTLYNMLLGTDGYKLGLTREDPFVCFLVHFINNPESIEASLGNLRMYVTTDHSKILRTTELSFEESLELSESQTPRSSQEQPSAYRSPGASQAYTSPASAAGAVSSQSSEDLFLFGGELYGGSQAPTQMVQQQAPAPAPQPVGQVLPAPPVLQPGAQLAQQEVLGFDEVDNMWNLDDLL